jgi:two-component system, OmpR family, sensor kinase
MGSIRTRITMAFAGAFMASLVLFALAILLARRQTAMRDVIRSATTEAEQVVMLLDRRSSLPDAVRIDPDSLIMPGVGNPMRRFLEIFDDYVLILDVGDYEEYASRRVTALPLGDRERLVAAARGMSDPGTVARVRLRTDDVVIAMRPWYGADEATVRRVFVALSERPARLAPRDLVATMLLVGPLLIFLSVGWAYLIAGRAFRPLDRMVDQVTAITDGRSLHRRLAIGSAGTELVRLAVKLNEMIERLETSFGALRRFTADASHELKTPLAVLRADVERAMSPTTRRDERAIALEEALEQVTRMAELVNSLLTLARADEGRLEVVQDAIVLDDLAREVVETARLLGEEAGVHIDASDIAPAEVRGDLMRLRQLFLNLVTNAIKYTPRGGTVTIALVRVGSEAHFSVRDTGIGIAAADLPYIFDRFWRADRSRSRAAERGGFGLGLAICQWIAHAHGGSLTVQSRLGRGSTFTAQLPLAVPVEASAGEPAGGSRGAGVSPSE